MVVEAAGCAKQNVYAFAKSGFLFFYGFTTHEGAWDYVDGAFEAAPGLFLALDAELACRTDYYNN